MKIDIAETEEADEYDGELWYYPMITEEEMQIIVVSNSLSKRIESFFPDCESQKQECPLPFQ